VRRRWQSLCTVWPSHSQWQSEQISFNTKMWLPILQLSWMLFWQGVTSPRSVGPPTAQIQLPATCDFSKLKSPLKERRFVSVMVTVHKLGQRRLTADWLAPQESDCSWMRSNFSSDWLPCYVYIKATWPVLLIFKIAGYFPDRPRVVGINCNNHLWLAAKLHQGHLTSSFDIQNSWTLSRQASYGRC